MPYSSDAFDRYIFDLIGLLRPTTVLDIGPGAGKYARIIRESVSNVHITAIEIDESYVERFDLRSKYDTLIIGDANSLIDTPRVRFDLVIIGDCIEHMRKSVAVDLLDFLVYRSGYICIVYPEAYIQDDWEGHAAEAHISTWSQEDFKGWQTIHRSWQAINLYLVKGYQPSRIIITS
jgi:SAM-dependent methyltransferase